MNPRTVAAKIITKVLSEGTSLTAALNEFLPNDKNSGLIQELSYGVIRWYFRLEKLAEQYLQKPFKRSDQDIHALLLVGFYQLIFMRTPDHAAVYETVTAVNDFKKTWAKNLINAVLRNFQRNREEALLLLDANPESAYAHPLWLIHLLQKNWPSQWQAIIAENNSYPPMTLRVNQQKMSRDSYIQLLEKKDIAAKASDFIATAITLEKPIVITELPGFVQGLISVQDEAAQIAATLLDLKPGQRVLDACAAPGGKSAHILETEKNLTELVAVDIDAKRALRIKENFTRLQLTGSIIIGDVIDTASWWDGQLFDRILLDAPCSATGVIRRHPDIKILRRENDIAALAEVQANLLTALWPLLQSGGILVYATCSVLPQENAEVMLKFLAEHPDAKEKKLTDAWGHAERVGRQILPGEHQMDGFYYAVLIKE